MLWYYLLGLGRNSEDQEPLLLKLDKPNKLTIIDGKIEKCLIDFYNKYITQLGLPFNEQAAQIRNDVNILGQTVLRSISGDSRFTNEDRDYIQEITGKEAMDKFQSYEQVLNAISQTQLLLEDRLSEAAGAIGVKPSHEMDAADLYAAYNNFRLDNDIPFKDSENYVCLKNYFDIKQLYDALKKKAEETEFNSLDAFNLLSPEIN